MILVIDCPCGAHLEIDEKFAGQMIQCPDCHCLLQAPVAENRNLRTSGLALASFILALAGAFTVLGTLLAILLGLLGLRSIARNPGRLTGNGYALAGIVLGVLLTAVSLIAYIRVEIFGLDRLLRERQWAGKLDYNEQPSDRSGFSMPRPSASWGVLRDSRDESLNDGEPTDVVLIDVRDDAQAIGFSFGKGPQLEDKTDSYRETALQKFVSSRLVRALNRTRGSAATPTPQVISSRQLPGQAGKDIPPQEVVFDISVGKYERTFIMHIIPGQDSIFVVAAGARKNRFETLEPQLRKIVSDFKLADHGAF